MDQRASALESFAFSMAAMPVLVAATLLGVARQRSPDLIMNQPLRVTIPLLCVSPVAATSAVAQEVLAKGNVTVGIQELSPWSMFL